MYEQSFGLSSLEIQSAIAALVDERLPRFELALRYYDNKMYPGPNGGYTQGQEWGLPGRLTGEASKGARPAERKEICIDNDIGWRVRTKVEYLVGKPLIIRSAVPGRVRRDQLNAVIRGIFASNGGMLFLQQVALTAGIWGFADWIVRLRDQPPPPMPLLPLQHHDLLGGDLARYEGEDPQFPAELTPLRELGRLISFDLVTGSRAIPFLEESDPKRLRAYAQFYTADAPSPEAEPPQLGWLGRLTWRWLPGRRQRDEMLYLIAPGGWALFRNGRRCGGGDNPLSTVPIAHVPGDAKPSTWFGAGDVSPLIALQDELNTRLCDRANRIALQCFKMYLALGIENFGTLRIGPGQMWHTENPQARIQEFGGDPGAPSEEQHILDVRNAMDKVSCVSPVAAGLIKDRLGNLTSAAALRITLIALLSEVTTRRTWFGLALQRATELALLWLDVAGHFHTQPEERRIEINWPSPLPENLAERLTEAEAKLRIGVPRPIVLAELGYDTAATAGKGSHEPSIPSAPATGAADPSSAPDASTGSSSGGPAGAAAS